MQISLCQDLHEKVHSPSLRMVHMCLFCADLSSIKVDGPSCDTHSAVFEIDETSIDIRLLWRAMLSIHPRPRQQRTGHTCCRVLSRSRRWPETMREPVGESWTLLMCKVSWISRVLSLIK